MKVASSFGIYEEEWKEGDLCGKGEVPCMITLIFAVSRVEITRGKRIYLLIPYPAADRNATPAHSISHTTSHALSSILVPICPTHRYWLRTSTIRSQTRRCAYRIMSILSIPIPHIPSAPVHHVRSIGWSSAIAIGRMERRSQV